MLSVAMLGMTPLFTVLASVLMLSPPWHHFEMGSSAEAVRAHSRDVSNLESWEETAFEWVAPDLPFFGEHRAHRCTLTYYHDRLLKFRCAFNELEYDKALALLEAEYGEMSSSSKGRRWRDAYWFRGRAGEATHDSVALSEDRTELWISYEDRSQKDFRWTDLFKGSTPWVILTIVGGLLAYLLLARAWTQRCPHCKKRGRRLKETRLTPEHALTWEGPEQVYTYRCSHCGEESEDRYRKRER